MPALSKYFRPVIKILAKVFIVLLVIFLELAILQILNVGGHGMMADTKYRHTERLAAYREYHEHPSPETKAAFRTEMRLMHAHEDWKGEVFLASLLIANGIGFYFYFRRNPKK